MLYLCHPIIIKVFKLFVLSTLLNHPCSGGMKGSEGVFFSINLKELAVDTLSFKTVSANKATVNKEWVVVDATNQSLGRVCSKVAKLLRGKYKPNFTPHVDCGDNVIIINADKVVLTGNKWNDRIYFRHTGYPGGQREFTPAQLKAKGEDHLFRKVVKGMLPKNRLGDKLLKNLYVYAGSEHKHEAQQPKSIDINSLN